MTRNRFLATVLAGTVSAALAGCTVREYSVESEDGSGSRTVRSPLAIRDVERMVEGGISEDVIIAKLNADGIRERPDADRIVDLKSRGFSDRLIEVMLKTPVAKPVVYRSPTVVYRYVSPGPYIWYRPWYYDPWCY